MRRLEDDGGSPGGAGGGGSGTSGRRVGPGPGNGMRRELEAGRMRVSEESSPGGGNSSTEGGGRDTGDRARSSGGRHWGGGFRGADRSWGGKRGPRIRKGVGAPMSRGDNSARPTAQQRAR
ncbi:unnamed protein product [Ectocarpus sp. 12 AP-2014]